MCFIKKIFNNEIDDSARNQFTRFGKGNFEGRAIAKFRKTVGKVKISTSFEYTNDIVKLVSEFGNGKCSGVVLSKKDLSEIIKTNRIIGASETKQGGLFFRNKINEQEINKEQIQSLIDNAYFCLLDIIGVGFTLKIKKNLPKPGRSGEAKIDDKFCQLEIDEKYWGPVKNCFFWDFPDVQKGNVSHNYLVTEIILPKNEKDFEKMRVMAKRKVKILRKIGTDSQKIVEKEAIV